MAEDLVRKIIENDIRSHDTGRKLTDEAVKRAVDHATKIAAKDPSLNWGQLRDIGIAHVQPELKK